MAIVQLFHYNPKIEKKCCIGEVSVAMGVLLIWALLLASVTVDLEMLVEILGLLKYNNQYYFLEANVCYLVLF